MENGRLTATPESVKFAIRKIEDVQSSEAAAQSGATTLSGVFYELQLVQNMLEEFYQLLMNAQANWEHIQNIEPNVENSMSKLQDVGKCTESALFTFMNKVADIKSSTVPDIFKLTNPRPVNFFALYNLMTDIQKIKSQVRTINIKHLGEPKDRPITQSAQKSHRNVDDIWLLGLEIHYKCILQRLIDQRHQTRSVVQVVGTKDFTKRVLAEKIYQSTEVKNHFEACFWLFPQIPLGLPHCNLFKPIEILRKMLLKLGDTNLFDAHDEDYHVMSRLHQSLNGKRCLVIVDNNWTELWTLVNTVFSDGNNGSRVLITSEKQGHNDYKYELPFLNYEESLKLVTELREKDSFEFEDDRILLKKGVEGHYSSLPSVLKMCIAYTAAVFPCGSIVLADSLIRLWVIEGIIPHEEQRTTESIGESYLDQLVQRGFLHIFDAYYHNQANHPIRSIVIHPRLHHIFNEAAQENTNFRYRYTYDEEEYSPVVVKHHIEVLDPDDDSDDDSEEFDENLRNLHRLVLHLPYQFNHISCFGNGPELQCLDYPILHSLFFFGCVAPVASSPFSFLRVLSVFSSHIRFPEEYTPCWLDGLINLRYLGFIVCLVEGGSLGKTLDCLGKLKILDLSASIVSGLSEFIKNSKEVKVVGPANEELPEYWSPIPDMYQ